MKLQELTSADAVIAAIDEFANVGRAAFLNRYGFKKATKFFVVHDGECFDSKAVAGVAFGNQFPSAGALTEPHRVMRGLEPLGGLGHDRSATAGEVPRRVA